MDTFVEQLVEIRNTGKVKLTKLFIWIACIMLSLGLICFSILKAHQSNFQVLQQVHVGLFFHMAK